MQQKQYARAELLKGKAILIMEDDQFISRAYTKWLKAAGASILEAHDGAHGLALADQEKVDFILLDLGMPGMNGYEALKHIRNNEKTKDVPVLVMTNTTMDESRDGYEEIMSLGVVGIRRKFETSLQELIDLITRNIT